MGHVFLDDFLDALDGDNVACRLEDGHGRRVVEDVMGHCAFVPLVSEKGQKLGGIVRVLVV